MPQNKQSSFYENAADKLTGIEQERALRAAQNHLSQNSDSYIEDLKRIQNKIVRCLETRNGS